jgi:organic hydroperoxide reductase OsmC/OhrA
MQALPHRYRVKGAGRTTGDVELTAERLTMIQSASPAEFDGPGDRWSPETLLVGAVADCFILTFRAGAKGSRLSWISLVCDATGTLDRQDRRLRKHRRLMAETSPVGRTSCIWQEGATQVTMSKTGCRRSENCKKR